ncbi:hypothetical protein BDR26DRAFT_406674 [Obelidium mucronatum]|nr:hypothetical protein BDR26DRAFT_406674 [Obelidium mucronatum]
MQSALGSEESNCQAGNDLYYKTDRTGNCVAITIKEAELSGPLPDLTTLTMLTYIDLSSNRFTGPIPSSWYSYGNLTGLNIGYNYLTGQAPASWSNRPQTYQWDLYSILGSYNEFTVFTRSYVTRVFGTTETGVYMAAQSNIAWSSPVSVITQGNILEITRETTDLYLVLSDSINTINEYGGNSFLYTTMNYGYNKYTVSGPSGGFSSWIRHISVEIDRSYIIHITGIGGDSVNKNLRRKSLRSGTWTSWVDLCGGSSGSIKDFATFFAENYNVVWTVGDAGLRKCTMSNSDPSGSWETISTDPNLVQIEVFGGYSIITLSSNGSLIYENTNILASSVKQFRLAQLQSSGTQLVYLSTSGEIKYRWIDGSSGFIDAAGITEPKVTSFQVEVLPNGDWLLFGLTETGTIGVAMAPQEIDVSVNCLTGNNGQRNAAQCRTSSSSTTTSTSSSSTSSSKTSSSNSPTATTTATTSTSGPTSQTTQSSTSESSSETTESSSMTSSTSTEETTTTEDFNLNGNNGINTGSSQSSDVSSTMPSGSLSASELSTATVPSTTSTSTPTPNADCLTIKEAFPTVQFNMDCSNIPANVTYPVSKPTSRRRRRQQTSTYIQFLNGRIIYVILPRMNLIGTISPALGNLAQMQILDLSENQLTGAIPPEIAKCSQLQSISFEKNQLVGSVPSELTAVLVANKADVKLGTNCLDNHTNQKSTCKKQEDNCIRVSLDTRYYSPQYQPLWDALAASANDMHAFDKLAKASGNFAFGEYMFQEFRKYAQELLWCALHHPGFSYKGI